MSDGDYYTRRERQAVCDYFRRKAAGIFLQRVPDLIIFEHVAACNVTALSMACERELRALFLNVGEPLSVAMCSELVESGGLESDGGDCARVTELRDMISEFEDDISDCERELNQLEKRGACGDDIPLISQLERLGA